MNDKPYKVIFGPDAFADFNGTQEELDELVEEIKRMVADGSIFENSEEIDPEDLSPELRARFDQAIDAFEAEDAKKRLH